MDLLRAIGNTPLINVDGVWAKLEYLNPSGSVKDRIAAYIVERAEAHGALRSGTIVEATTGNTGIAFAFVAAVKGYRMVAVLPRGLSNERTRLLKGLGARVVPAKDVESAVLIAKGLAKRNGWFMPRQFETPWNPAEQRIGMGKEIASALGRVDCFVAGVGTGGTLIGCGQALRAKWPRTRLVAVEPAECRLLRAAGIGRTGAGSGLRQSSRGAPLRGKARCGRHGIEGIGDGFVPRIIEEHAGMVDEVIAVRSAAAVRAAKMLCRKGFLVGPSSGANYLAAQQMRKHGVVATVFPDSALRYLSEGLL